MEWALRFVRSVRDAEPSAVGTEEVKRFLEKLAVEGKVSASTQNQALNALLFFFRAGLGRQLGQLGEFERAAVGFEGIGKACFGGVMQLEDQLAVGRGEGVGVVGKRSGSACDDQGRNQTPSADAPVIRPTSPRPFFARERRATPPPAK